MFKELNNFYNPPVLKDILEGEAISIDKTNPEKPIISSTGGGANGVQSVSGDVVDNTDPQNPVVSIPSANIPDWEESKSYNINDTVIVKINGDPIIFRSTIDNNDTSPELTNPWVLIGDESSLQNYDPETTYHTGDKAILDLEGSTLIFCEALTDNPGDPTVGIFNTWGLLGVSWSPINWDPSTEYTLYSGMYPTVVLKNNNYYSTNRNVINIDPESEDTWEKIERSELKFDENFRKDDDGTLKLGSFNPEDGWWYITNRGHSIATTEGSINMYTARKQTSAESILTLSGTNNNYKSANIRARATGEGWVHGNEYPFVSTELNLYSALDNEFSVREASLGYTLATSRFNQINKSIKLKEDFIIIADDRLGDRDNQIGMIYASDYSLAGKNNDRWIPDWGTVKNYVDENSGNVEVGSGLHLSSDGKIKLGLDPSTLGSTNVGLLDGPTNLILGDVLDSNYTGLSLNENSFELVKMDSFNTGSGISLNVATGNGLSLFRRIGNAYKQIALTDSSIEVIDAVNYKGLQYQYDYSENGTTDDRWIPDWGAVKSLKLEDIIANNIDYGTVASVNLSDITLLDVKMLTGSSLQTKLSLGMYNSFISSYSSDRYIGVNMTEPYLRNVSAYLRLNNTNLELYSNSSSTSLKIPLDRGSVGQILVQSEDGLLTFTQQNLTNAQRLAINALTIPTEDFADLTEVTNAIKNIIDALQA